MTAVRGLFLPSGSLPPLYSDEFENPATLSGPWGENAGDPTTIHLDIDTTIAGALYMQGQLYKVAPAPPFTVFAKVIYVDWPRNGFGVPTVGSIFVNIAAAAPGPYFGAGIDVGTVGFMNLMGSKFDAAGAFVSNHYTTLYQVTDDSYAVPHMTRMVVHSMTNVDWSVSFDDGLTWLDELVGYNPGFTINYIGLEAGGIYGWDYFRVTQP